MLKAIPLEKIVSRKKEKRGFLSNVTDGSSPVDHIQKRTSKREL